MAKFAFVIHPLNARDVERRYRLAKYAPESLIETFLRFKHPVVASEITGIRSKTGATTEGWFMGCPLTSHQLVTLPEELVYKRLVKCAEMAADKGAKLIGLGAFTSVVGDGGITVAKRSSIGVTTGNSYTVATAIQGTLKACHLLDVDVKNATLAVVGATGSIGRTCSLILGKEFGQLTLVGRDLERTTAVAAEIGGGATASDDVAAIRSADAVITVTSSESAVVLPEHLKPGAVVCDVARPRDVSVRVAQERPDVLVIEGGVVKVPGDVEFRFNFGFPEKTAYACMSETMILALEEDPSLYSFTLGKDVSVDQVEKITALAEKHGFELAGFRSFEHAVDDATIARARKARLMAHSVPRTA